MTHAQAKSQLHQEKVGSILHKISLKSQVFHSSFPKYGQFHHSIYKWVCGDHPCAIYSLKGIEGSYAKVFAVLHWMEVLRF